jgi:hypothetical protein
MFATIDHFDALTEKGLKVIPLRANSKVPMCKGWNTGWDLQKARSRLEMFPDANIGLLLGDVIDVEGDNEEANNILNRLIGDYPHPSYQSIRSVHHLFSTPDPKLRIFKVGEIEFRGYGHQSVLPPSSHYGFQYQWLPDFCFPAPEMPEPLRVFYFRHKLGRTIKPGHMKIRCSRCGEKRYLHCRRFNLELTAFQALNLGWECQRCRQIDLRPACRMVRRGITGD